MEDSPGSHPGPQGRRGTDGSQAEPAPAAMAEQETEPAVAGSDPDDDNGWLPV